MSSPHRLENWLALSSGFTPSNLRPVLALQPSDPSHRVLGDADPPVKLQSHSRPMKAFRRGFWAEWRVMGWVHACWT